MKEINMTEVFEAFDVKLKSLLENDHEEIIKDITKDRKLNPSRMPAFQVQTSPDIVLRVQVALPESSMFHPITAQLWYVDRNKERFPGILMWYACGDSVDDAVENLFIDWNKRNADEMVHTIHDMFWHVNSDKASQYDNNKEIMRGEWYRKPLFVRSEQSLHPLTGGVEEKEHGNENQRIP